MSNHTGGVVGGSCLGGIIGCMAGIGIGALLGMTWLAPTPRETKDMKPEEALAGCLGDMIAPIIAPIFWGGIGGIIGAVAGSALGAGIASRLGTVTKPQGLDATTALTVAGNQRSSTMPPPMPESPETELNRLRERIAELEQKKNTDIKPDEAEREEG